MNKAIQNLIDAQERAVTIDSKEKGFPYLAETLRQAGVSRNIWHLPSCHSIYITCYGPVVVPGTSLIDDITTPPPFDQQALIKALQADQSGLSTFAQFLKAAWKAGVVTYSVDFEKREVTYSGLLGESYTEKYPCIEITHD